MYSTFFSPGKSEDPEDAPTLPGITDQLCLDQPSKWLDKETKVLVSDMYMDSFMDYAETGFPGGASGKESACQSRTRLGRSPAGGQGNPFQYSCLENPMDREAWWATVQRVAKSRT